MDKLRAPFIWHGSKIAVGPRLWDEINSAGTTPARALIDPFAGSLATYLTAPDSVRSAILGDIDAHLINLWRGLQHDPTIIEEIARWPVDNLTSTAAGNHMLRTKDDLPGLLREDPWWFDRDSALTALWSYTYSIKPESKGGVSYDYSQRQLVTRTSALRIKEALNPGRLTLVHGSWDKVLTNGRLNKFLRNHKTVAVILDPPYQGSHTEYKGQNNPDLARDAYAWALEHSGTPGLKIAVCGLASDAPELTRANWSQLTWRRGSGLAGAAGNISETIWLSPSISTNTEGRRR